MKVCPKCGAQYGDDANFCTVDAGRLVAMTAPGAGPEPAAAPAAPANLVGGRFELGAQVGGGATGAVHRATDTQTGAAVAVKLIAAESIAQPGVAQRVERELKLLEKVDHPAVARVLASGRHGEQLWYAMEWVDGAAPLAAMVPDGGIEAERASELAVTVGNALVEAAKVGVVHRDLSPKNVLVAGNTIKLINFALPVPGERVPGAPSFVSPEAIEGKPIDQRSATYSLGALYYYLLTGVPPFVGDPGSIHAAHLSGSAVPPSQKAAVPADVDSLVGRAMHRKPTQRFLTLRQFVDDIEKVKKGPEGGVGSTAPFGRAGKKPKELAQTMLGLGPMPGMEAPTRQMDVQIPPEALREAAALDAAVATGTNGGYAPAEAAAIPAAAPVTTLPGYAQPTAAPAPQPVVTQAAPAAAPPPSAEAASSSPWAPPAAAQATPAAAEATPVAVQAAPAAAVEPVAPQAPKVPVAVTPAASLAGGQPTGKRKPEAKEKKASKGKFRETMWFKKGDLDAAAAEAAAQDKEGASSDKADSLPIEERYSDDGTITTGDAARYSLKTGQTSSMPVMRGDPSAAASGAVSEDELIGEMKGGRKIVLILIALGVIAAVAIAIVFAM